jgi:subtilisin family serine protease
MSPLWSWLRRPSANGRPTTAPSRPSRPSQSRVSFETLEDRIAPSAASANDDARRALRFHVDDAVVAVDSPVATAAANYANQSFGGLIGLDQVFATSPYRGAGYSVAVIDTGVDYNHPDLGGGWGKRVVAGWDFVNNDADPMDDNGHGTHVAGIIGSSNAAYAGIAPNINIVALKVLGADGSGSYGAVEDALNWVIANRAKYNIVSINMSLGSGNFAINPYELLEDEFGALKSAGVFLSVAAGNGYYTYQGQPGLAFPGISPNVVSVGAVWDGNFGAMAWGSGARDNTTAPDRIASFSQRSAGLDILAPGAMVTSTYLGGRQQVMAGTSMASPVIAGAAALLHQALDGVGKSNLANQDGILGLMKSTGVRVVDGDDENDNVANTGLAFQRLNLAAALNAIGQAVNPTPNPPMPPPNGAPILAAIVDQSVVAGNALTIGLSATDPNGDAISYSARVLGLPNDPDQAYRLRQSLGLYSLGTYYVNAFGLDEKWLGGAGGAYYTILPSGELRRWTGTAASTLNAANLIANLDPSFYSDPERLLNAQPGAVNPVTLVLSGNQLTLTTAPEAAGNYQVEVSASDGKLAATRVCNVAVTAAVANRAPVWTSIADQRLAPKQTTLTIPLNARDPDGQALTFSARVLNAAGIGATINGNQLTLSLPTKFAGTFTVELIAGDGHLTSTTSFRVTASNAPPTLTIPDRITAPGGATRIVIPIAVADADGDSLTVSATAAAGGADSSLAAQLKATYGLTYSGSYFTNAYGFGEKWLKSADGLQFFCILPNGELHKFTGAVASVSATETLLATLDATYYDDPSKLWNATPAAGPRLETTATDKEVVLTLQSSFQGSVAVEVAVTDGVTVVRKSVIVSFPQANSGAAALSGLSATSQSAKLGSPVLLSRPRGRS